MGTKGEGDAGRRCGVTRGERVRHVACVLTRLQIVPFGQLVDRPAK